ncbi:hypothetical protein [Modestobacter sp. DSM 44400]|uniref:hypothetical protein n=1 Tax=Modestobacter sp. DSM 44400 TaxID=1550230 RepID=UPI0011153684|nr:hypothetical protein [Modestobacter sp. DSM 44400]
MDVLVVELAPEWPVDQARTVTIACEGQCSDPSAGGQGAGERIEPVTASEAVFYWGAQADSVGRTEECGGPQRATVTVPAP